MDKENVVQIYGGILLSQKKRMKNPMDRGGWWATVPGVERVGHDLVTKPPHTMPFAATWMPLEIITPREVSTKEKDKYRMTSLICGIQNMTQMNLFTKQKQAHRHRAQILWLPKGREVGKGWSGRLGSGEANHYT